MSLKPNAMTDAARVKRLLDPTSTGVGANAAFDAVIEDLINAASDRIESKLQRTIRELLYTHYFPGTGTEFLGLSEGPLVSVASVSEVAYVDGGSGARQENLTALDPYQYVEHGMRSGEAYRGLAFLERVDGGVFTAGARNWQVVYTAGWSTVPEALVDWAAYRAAHQFVTRESPGLISKVSEDWQHNLLSPKQLDEQEDRILRPFREVVVG